MMRLFSGNITRVLLVVLLASVFAADCGVFHKESGYKNKAVPENNHSSNANSSASDTGYDYRKMYEKKIKIIKQTSNVINDVFKYLKENHYEQYPQVKALVEDAIDRLNQGKNAEVQYKNYAKEGKWKEAFISAERFWQNQVKAAETVLQAKKLLSNKLHEDE